MSTVVIIAVGSRGDVAPLTGPATRLLAAGHRVIMAAFSPFADMITTSGVEYREIPRALADNADTDPLRSLAAFASPAGMRALGMSVIQTLAGDRADVFLLSPLAEMVGHPIAEACGAAVIGVRLQPLSATRAHPPAVLGGWTAGRPVNYAVAHAGSQVFDITYRTTIRDLRRELGLPGMSATALRRSRTDARWPILHGYSELVAPRPPDWRDGLEVTGYWWPQTDPSWRPSSPLRDFLDFGPPPVFIGFGSAILSEAKSVSLSATIAAALRRAEVRGIVQAGWTGLEVRDDHMMTVGELPHEWLFPRVAAVAHHCGAGTTAAGLRAGVPTIGLPIAGDGPFWARRLRAIGAARTTIAMRRLTADRLARALRDTLTDSGLRDRTQELADRIATEDGAARVVEAVDRAC